MGKLCVQGPTKLQGEVTTPGVKNAVLSILFATLLAEEPVEIQNVPELKDADTPMKLLNQLGAKVERNGSVYIGACNVSVFYTPYDLVKTMRAPIWAPGSLVARFGQGRISLLGGCTIGVRPADLRITGLEQLSATIKLEEGYMKAPINGHPEGAYITMGKVSVGMTVAIMCAAAPVEGIAIIGNAAHGSEIVNTANLLIVLGAEITDQGIDRITIEGAERLGGGAYRVLSDHTEAGTFLVAAAASRGKIICHNAQPDTLDAVLTKLCDVGADIEVDDNWVSLGMHGKRLRAVNVCTTPHPAFPTGMQAQFMLLNLVAEGADFITETVFRNRFIHVPELNRMGVHTKIESNTVIYHGVEAPFSTQVMATDLYASAGLVLAGCIVEDTTVTDRIYHIDRDCERIEDKLRVLSANIERVRDE